VLQQDQQSWQNTPPRSALDIEPTAQVIGINRLPKQFANIVGIDRGDLFAQSADTLSL